MDVLRIADFTGAAPNISDAYTINGQPGDLYRCSKQGSPVILFFFFFLLSDLFSSNFNL
jgi:hypothetical protein